MAIPRELLKKIRKIEIYTSRLVNNQLAGQYQSVFRGRGMAFSEVRQYVPGDDVRSIDWNVSARMNDPHIKLFTEERDRTVAKVALQVGVASRVEPRGVEHRGFRIAGEIIPRSCHGLVDVGVDERLDLVRRLVAGHHELALALRDADLDLHRVTSWS